ncbi:MAG: Plug domain-containing protein, partial [Deltaproteobacteria bacterium]
MVSHLPVRAGNEGKDAGKARAQSERSGEKRHGGGDEKEGKEPETIVIRARPLRLPGAGHPRSTSIIGAAELNNPGHRSLSDAVGTMPGVYLQKTNRGAGAPFLRGLVGPQNLILVDGIRYNNSTFRTGPNQYLALIDPALLENVQVVLGPGSVLYGSDAMGGVVELFPRNRPGSAPFGGSAGAGFASADLSTGAWLDAGGGTRSWYLASGAVARRFGTLRAGGGEPQPVSGYWRAGWHEHLEVSPLPGMVLSANYLGARVRGAGRADRLNEGRFRFYDNDDDLVWLDWRWAPDGPIRAVRAAVSMHHTFERVDLYRCTLEQPVNPEDAVACTTGAPFEPEELPPDPLYRQTVKEDRVFTAGALLRLRAKLWRLELVVGADGYFDFVSSQASERRAGNEPSWQWQELARGNFS